MIPLKKLPKAAIYQHGIGRRIQNILLPRVTYKMRQTPHYCPVIKGNMIEIKY